MILMMEKHVIYLKTILMHMVVINVEKMDYGVKNAYLIIVI